MNHWNQWSDSYEYRNHVAPNHFFLESDCCRTCYWIRIEEWRTLMVPNKANMKKGLLSPWAGSEVQPNNQHSSRRRPIECFSAATVVSGNTTLLALPNPGRHERTDTAEFFLVDAGTRRGAGFSRRTGRVAVFGRSRHSTLSDTDRCHEFSCNIFYSETISGFSLITRLLAYHACSELDAIFFPDDRRVTAAGGARAGPFLDQPGCPRLQQFLDAAGPAVPRRLRGGSRKERGTYSKFGIRLDFSK